MSMSRARKIIAIFFVVFVFLLTIVPTTTSLEAQETTREQELQILKERLNVLKTSPQNPFTKSRISKLEAQIADLEDSGCLSCALVIRYASLTNEYVEKLSAKLRPGMVIMFGSLVGLWIVIQGYKLFFGIMKPEQLYLEFMYVAIGSILLNHVGISLVQDVYKASLSLMAGASSIAFVLAEKVDLQAFSGTPGVEQYKDLIQLVYTVEHAVRKVIDVGSKLLSSSKSPSNFVKNIFFALILIIPYFFVMVVFFAQLVLSVFRLMMLAAFSPFLMMAYAFGWGRGMGQAAIRTLISSIATLFAVTAAVAVVVYAVDQADAVLNGVSGAGKDISLSNAELITLVMMGLMGTAFMVEATNIANSITGSALGNSGATVITGGAAAIGAGALAQKSRINPLSWGRGYSNLGGSVGGGIQGLSSLKGDIARPSNLYEKFKSVSRGGSS